MDQIRIENLELFCNHGAKPEENVLGQKFYVSATLHLDTRKAGLTDDLAASAHYGKVSRRIKAVMENNTYQLIERCAEVLARTILLEFPSVQGIDLEVKKPWAPIGLPVEYVSVCVHRRWHTVYLSIGSNMGDRRGYLYLAVERLSGMEEVRVTKKSDYIVTKPYGNVEQEDFLNGCLELRTLLSPHELLAALHEIEAMAGRERKIRWGPRTLDLDILLYDDRILDSKTLTIPHREMHLRRFVLEPLSSIAPYAVHPLYHCSVQELWERLQAGETGENTVEKGK